MQKGGDNLSWRGYLAAVMSIGKLALRISSVAALACVLAACSRAQPPAKPKPAPPPPAAAPKPAEPPKPPPPPPPEPRLVVEGNGIRIVEAVDGRVILKTTLLWNEAIDTTYDNCDYYRKAVPVLQRQIAPDRAKFLDGVCIPEKPKAKKAKKKT